VWKQTRTSSTAVIQQCGGYGTQQPSNAVQVQADAHLQYSTAGLQYCSGYGIQQQCRNMYLCVLFALPSLMQACRGSTLTHASEA
jgi:hypothetical protein